MQNGSNAAISYQYDANGNITQIYEGGVLKVTYTYDNLNQLAREDNVYLNKSITYTYDLGGNILEKDEYAYSTEDPGAIINITPYSYGDSSWKDLLTCYNGNFITYDQIGNPLTYRDGMTMTWQMGRRLATLTNNGVASSYNYDDSGIRINKTVNGTTTDYYLNGSTILAEVTGGVETDYYYDADGNLFGFKKNGNEYYYLRNGQNDIIGILDSTGTQVVSYLYDTWGKLISITGSLASTIGTQNPFRYRGYYYDNESGLYYLNSRYYDPQTGRFINADGAINSSQGPLGCNMFTYCLNNPVNMCDPTGNKPGDRFDTVDEAARDAALYMGDMSFDNCWEYATSIYEVNTVIKTYRFLTKTYKFLWWTWTKTIIETTETIKIQYTYKKVSTNKDSIKVYVPNAPFGKKRVATVHTHPMGSGKGITMFSPGDIKFSNNTSKVPNYLYGPDGVLKKYDPATGLDLDVFTDLPRSYKRPWLD